MSIVIKCALLIDDNRIDQRQYKRVLMRSGLVEEVVAFSFADEALRFLKDNPEKVVDVIFLDINMPRMNGFEFLEAATSEIGADFTKVVVAMLTTSLNPEDRSRAETYDVVKQFISKPLTEQHVHDVAAFL